MADTDIVTLAEAKKHLNIPLSDTSQDDELAAFIESVTAVVEHVVGPVVPREVVEVHDGGAGALVLRKPPVLSITAVVENGVALAGDVYTTALQAGVLYRSSASSSRATWAGGRGGVVATYQAGRAATLPGAKQAAKDLIALHFRPQQGGNFSPFGSGDDSAEASREILGFFVPGRVLQMLAPHAQIDGFA